MVFFSFYILSSKFKLLQINVFKQLSYKNQGISKDVTLYTTSPSS